MKNQAVYPLSLTAAINGFIGQVRRELSAGLESKDQSAVPDRNGTHERTPSAETEDEWEP